MLERTTLTRGGTYDVKDAGSGADPVASKIRSLHHQRHLYRVSCAQRTETGYHIVDFVNGLSISLNPAMTRMGRTGAAKLNDAIIKRVLGLPVPRRLSSQRFCKHEIQLLKRGAGTARSRQTSSRELTHGHHCPSSARRHGPTAGATDDLLQRPAARREELLRLVKIDRLTAGN